MLREYTIRFAWKDTIGIWKYVSLHYNSQGHSSVNLIIRIEFLSTPRGAEEEKYVEDALNRESAWQEEESVEEWNLGALK